MNDRRSQSIGLFDSGIGGLTVMKQLKQQLTSESVIYFGDTARVPYGGKSKETICRYSIENATFLIEKEIKLLVVACNTASAFALEPLRQRFDIPIIGVIEPGAIEAARVTNNQRLAVLGTKGTIESGAYQRAIQSYLPEAVIFPIACPLLAPLVEERFWNHPATKLIIKDYLLPLKNKQVDTVLLGCTHYPFLKHLIEEEMGERVKVINSAQACVEQVFRLLNQEELTSKSPRASYHYYVSDDPERFRLMAEELFEQTIEHVHLVS